MQIIVRQISGLGNQLFQYAAGRYYAKRYGANMKMAIDPERNAVSYGSPRPFLLSHFSIAVTVRELTLFDRLMLSAKPRVGLVTAPIRRALGIRVFREQFAQRHTFFPELPIKGEVDTLYLAGYWQTYRISEEIADELRVELSFKEPAQGKTLEVLQQIRQTRNAVSLHVRRGDYTLAAEGKIALPIDYYIRAISTFEERLIDPTFFVFSDDMAFIKKNLPRNVRAVFVDHNDNSVSHEDLRLMASCHHHIIANSTFSWWGAWLNPRLDKIVVAPKFWRLKAESYYPDLLPPDWTLIDIASTR
jgi:hypothetical protein